MSFCQRLYTPIMASHWLILVGLTENIRGAVIAAKKYGQVQLADRWHHLIQRNQI